ncbi:MAG TPA: glutathione binding-like protein [Candidatus Cybelea sp.]|nr:glutathione binding-like protein [Candidatus Cybelea sp.]
MIEGTMRFYYSPGACSLASHVMLEEAGAVYEAEQVLVSKPNRENLSKRYLAVNPKGYVPALEIEDRVLTENAAIMLYIAHQYPQARLLPYDSLELAKCFEWLVWQTNTAHVVFAQLWRPERFLDDEAQHSMLTDAAKPRVRKVLSDVETWLATHEYAAGTQYSIADGMFLALYRWGWRAGETMSTETCPAWTAYMKRVMQRPAVVRVLKSERVALLPA